MENRTEQSAAAGGGGEKDMMSNFPEEYSSDYVEAEWEAKRKKQGIVKSGNEKTEAEQSKTKFVTVLSPLPNEASSAPKNIFQDVVIRWHRTRGDNILAIPRCPDQTSTYLESNPEYSKVVTEAFVKLHGEGLIYRQYKFVDWSCALKRNVSEIEIDKINLTGPTYLSIPGHEDEIEFGVSVRFTYQIDDGSGDKIEVATTRIETMLGDCAIVSRRHLNHHMMRYKHLVGKTAKHPFCDRKLKIIADDTVDVGTGARKIAPGHYPEDYEIAKRHNVHRHVSVFNDHGNIFEPVWMGDGKFNGMKRFHARKAIIEELKALDLYLGTEPCPMVLSICSQTKDVVEPMYRANWYLKCDSSRKTIADFQSGDAANLVPESETDWCISRQLKQGGLIDVPAYYVRLNNRCSGKPIAGTEANAHRISGSCRQEVLEKAARRYRTTIDHVVLAKDEHVLDPYFSTIIAWLDETKDLTPKVFVGIRDDDTWWVTKILLLGQRLHGPVFDQMCVLEKPKDVVSTNQSDGMDALRFSLCSGRDLSDGKDFCKTIWTATRTALGYFEDFEPLRDNDLISEEQDLWILNRSVFAVSEANKAFESCDFVAVSNAIYNFWHDELCDIYLENLRPIFASEDAAAKKTARAALYRVLEVGLRLLSPVMPFLSEELYQRLPNGSN